MYVDEKSVTTPGKLIFKKFFKYLDTCHVFMSDLVN